MTYVQVLARGNSYKSRVAGRADFSARQERHLKKKLKIPQTAVCQELVPLVSSWCQTDIASSPILLKGLRHRHRVGPVDRPEEHIGPALCPICPQRLPVHRKISVFLGISTDQGRCGKPRVELTRAIRGVLLEGSTCDQLRWKLLLISNFTPWGLRPTLSAILSANYIRS